MADPAVDAMADEDVDDNRDMEEDEEAEAAWELRLVDSILRVPGVFLVEAIYLQFKLPPEELKQDGKAGLILAMSFMAAILILCPLPGLVHLYLTSITAVWFYVADTYSCQFKHSELSENEMPLSKIFLLLMAGELVSRLLMGEKLRFYQSPSLYLLPVLAEMSVLIPFSVTSWLHIIIRSFLVLSFVPLVIRTAFSLIGFASYYVELARIAVVHTGKWRVLFYLLSKWSSPWPISLFWIASALNQIWQQYLNPTPLLDMGGLDEPELYQIRRFYAVAASLQSSVSLVAMCVFFGYFHAALRMFVLAYLRSCVPTFQPPEDLLQESGILVSAFLLLYSLLFEIMGMSIEHRALSLAFVFHIVVFFLLISLQHLSGPVLLILAENSDDVVIHCKAATVVLAVLAGSFRAMAEYLLLYDKLLVWNLWASLALWPGILAIAEGTSFLIHYAVVTYCRLLKPWMPPAEVKYGVSYYLLIAFSIVSMYLCQRSFFGFVGSSDTWPEWTAHSVLWGVFTFRTFQGTLVEILGRTRANQLLHLLPDATPDLIADRNDACPICQLQMLPHSEAVVKILPCGHLYHRECFRPWLYHNNTCPMCNADVLEAIFDVINERPHEE